MKNVQHYTKNETKNIDFIKKGDMIFKIKSIALPFKKFRKEAEFYKNLKKSALNNQLSSARFYEEKAGFIKKHLEITDEQLENLLLPEINEIFEFVYIAIKKSKLENIYEVSKYKTDQVKIKDFNDIEVFTTPNLSLKDFKIMADKQENIRLLADNEVEFYSKIVDFCIEYTNLNQEQLEEMLINDIEFLFGVIFTIAQSYEYYLKIIENAGK